MLRPPPLAAHGPHLSSGRRKAFFTASKLYEKVGIVMPTPEERLDTLAKAVRLLANAIRQLNFETYMEFKGDFERIPERPRVQGYQEVKSALEDVERLLEQQT